MTVRLLAILKEPELSSMRFERLSHLSGQVEVESVEDPVRAMDLVAEAEVLVTIGPVLGAHAADVFSNARMLKWVQSIGTGVDNILGHPALPASVAVTNVRGVHGAQMSEAALAAMLALARDLRRQFRNQSASRWERFPPALLAGSTVGIVGVGAIAAALAPRCRALGMTVVGFSSSPRPVEHFDRVLPLSDLPGGVAEVDHLVILTPYSPRTHHLVNARVLASMKPAGLIINLARGGVLDEGALLAALDAESIGGAALDVFSQEPLPPDSRLWSHPKVLVSPHLGGFHRDYAEQVMTVISDNLSRYLEGGTSALVNRIN